MKCQCQLIVIKAVLATDQTREAAVATGNMSTWAPGGQNSDGSGTNPDVWQPPADRQKVSRGIYLLSSGFMALAHNGGTLET
jgi:hypothetical protein